MYLHFPVLCPAIVSLIGYNPGSGKRTLSAVREIQWVMSPSRRNVSKPVWSLKQTMSWAGPVTKEAKVQNALINVQKNPNRLGPVIKITVISEMWCLPGNVSLTIQDATWQVHLSQAFRLYWSILLVRTYNEDVWSLHEKAKNSPNRVHTKEKFTGTSEPIAWISVNLSKTSLPLKFLGNHIWTHCTGSSEIATCRLSPDQEVRTNSWVLLSISMSQFPAIWWVRMLFVNFVMNLLQSADSLWLICRKHVNQLFEVLIVMMLSARASVCLCGFDHRAVSMKPPVAIINPLIWCNWFKVRKPVSRGQKEWRTPRKWWLGVRVFFLLRGGRKGSPRGREWGDDFSWKTPGVGVSPAGRGPGGCLRGIWGGGG